MKKIKSIYIHIPFCSKICFYCDFTKMIPQRVDDYVNALVLELEKRIDFGNKYETIYFGGGTPSILTVEQLEKIFNVLNKLELEPNYEITFEGNVESFTKEKLEYLKNNRVNRISVGMQTLNNDLLKIINREHTKEMFISFLNDCKIVGLESVNIDLMFALPNQTMDDLNKDLEQIFELNINHLSIYSLILEENSVFGKNYKKYKFADEDLEYEMYNHVINTLKLNGYDHYEVSNFAKVGYESKHNMMYWDTKEYYGCGLGASGYVDDVRYENVKNINTYIEKSSSLDEISNVVEILDIEAKKKEFILVGLRKLKGIKKSEYQKRFNSSIDIDFKEVLESLENEKLICRNYDIIRLSSNAIFVANDVYEKFI